MRSAKLQLESYSKLLKDNPNAEELIKKGKSLIKRIDTWEQNLIQPNQKTFQDVINYNNKLNAELMYLKSYVDTPIPKVSRGAKERLKDLLKDWKTYEDEQNDIVNTEMKAYNELYKKLELPAVIIKKQP